MQKFKSLNYKLLAKVTIDAILLGLVLFNLIKLTLAVSTLMVAKHSLGVILALFSAFVINHGK